MTIRTRRGVQDRELQDGDCAGRILFFDRPPGYDPTLVEPLGGGLAIDHNAPAVCVAEANSWGGIEIHDAAGFRRVLDQCEAERRIDPLLLARCRTALARVMN